MSANSTEIYMEKHCGKDNPIFDLKLAERIAACTLYKQGKGKVKPTRDNIDFIMSYVVRGYTTFDSRRGLTLRNYLIGAAKLAVKHILLNRKNRFLSLDRDIGEWENWTGKNILASHSEGNIEDKLVYNEIIDFIKVNRYFNERQRTVLLSIFQDNLGLSDAADELGIHRSYAYYLLNDGIEKLRREFNEE